MNWEEEIRQFLGIKEDRSAEINLQELRTHLEVHLQCEHYRRLRQDYTRARLNVKNETSTYQKLKHER